MTDVNNMQDVLDSRDIEARAQELADDHHDLAHAVEDARKELDEARIAGRDTADAEDALADAERELAEWEADNLDELQALRDLQEQAQSYCPDWSYGATLIRDSYFQDYAEELADDIGAIDRNATWPINCIDWEQAARELKQDYTSVDFDGVTYWVR